MKTQIFLSGVIPFIFLLLLCGCATGVSEEEAAGLYFNLGNAYSELGKDSDAVKAYESARRLDPDLFQAGYNLARLHVEAGRFEEGRVLLDSLLAVDPENVILLEAAAWNSFREGKEDECKSLYNQILELQYHHPRALYNLSRIYLNNDELEEAAELLYILWEEGGSEAGVPGKNELLLEWCRLQMKLDEGEKALESLLYLESEAPSKEIYHLIGDVYSEQEKYGLALEVYEKALDGNEPLPEILFKKARILLTIVEDEDEGLAVLSKAIEAGYRSIDDFNKLLEYEGLLFVDAVNNLYSEAGIELVEPDSDDKAENTDGATLNQGAEAESGDDEEESTDLPILPEN
ncbi:MAG: tetratricopeptide repeat protein [Spirochaetales bacterium]|nr:tetratricopeptide repeat protein [Spirochaetales bacterium]